MQSHQTGISKLLLIGVILLVVLLGGAGGAAWFLLHHGAARGGATAAAAPAKALFMGIDPFTVNLEGGDRLLYIGVTLRVDDDDTRNFLNAKLPEVRNRLLMVLSGQSADVLVTSAGKQRLAEAIRTALLQQFREQRPHLALDEVLFTQFIVQ